MRLWKIVPVTPPTDPRWQGRRVWSEVLVRAESAAVARLIAGELDREPSIGVGNETLDSRSGFDDEKLYWVMETDAAAGSQSGDPGIVAATPLAAGGTAPRS